MQNQTIPEFQVYLSRLETEFKIDHIDADSVNWSDVLILDVREKEEYDVSHIKHAVWVGYDDFEFWRVDSMGRNQEIIVYCSVGYRSSKIGLKLLDNGFTHVKNLKGGIFGWANEGRPLYLQNKRTRQIHAYDRFWGRFLVNPDIIHIY
jgi:rhodanese-related sulfurtransferase